MLRVLTFKIVVKGLPAIDTEERFKERAGLINYAIENVLNAHGLVPIRFLGGKSLPPTIEDINAT